jgi:hypothetical protein
MTFGSRTLGYFPSAAAPPSGIVNPLTLDGDLYSSQKSGGGTADSTVTLLSDGTWTGAAVPDVGSTGPASGNWYSPTTVGIGSSYWVRFTRNSITQSGATSASASTGWLALSSTRSITVSAGSATGDVFANYTIEIASDSGGVTIVSTSTVDLEAIKV